jgi:hypothetical protein
MSESIQKSSIHDDVIQNAGCHDDHGCTTLCADETARPSPELDFWRFAAEQYGIWLDEDEWRALAELDDHLLIARRYFWRLSDPEIHELLCALPDE